ncbi:hypothetical protein [Ruminococcus albus]|uniref:hypothetical protein n=1 Tax=Ruminococcus albus TaxID=1264 RepID=UPI00094311ED|nr:hypothetical protein [Ruminococcus albus]
MCLSVYGEALDIDNIEQLGYLGLLIAAEKYAAISKLLHGRSEKDCADAMRSFLDSIDLRVRLSDEGFTKEVIS